MTFPPVSKNNNNNNNNLKLAPDHPPTKKGAGGNGNGKQKKKKPRGPSKRSIGLETSSVVSPPEIPHRDDLSLLSSSLEQSKDMKKSPSFAETMNVSKSKSLEGNTRPSPGVQRLVSTTSTVPPPPPNGGLRRQNRTENVHPGAVRMAGLRTISNNTIQIGDSHPPTRNYPSSTNPTPPPAVSSLVRAFLVEDPPTAAVAPVSRRTVSEPPRLTHFSGISQESTVMIMTTKDDPVSAVPMAPPHRSFCDLLRDWRVLALMCIFSLLVGAAIVVGLGIYGGMNFSFLSNHKSLEAQTLGPSVSYSPTTMPMPMPTPMPVNSVSSPTRAPTRAPTRQTVTRAPVLRPTRAPTTYTSPTRSPTQEPNSYEGDYEDDHEGDEED